MDLVSTFNPPRLIQLGGDPFWIRGYTIADFALIVAWLDDVIPGQSDRMLPIALCSDEAKGMLNSLDGREVLLWTALRYINVSREEVFKIACSASFEEWDKFISVAMRRRKTFQATGDGVDIGQAWWGPLVEGLFTNRNISPAQIGELTLDQIDMLTQEGLPHEKPGVLTIEEVQAMWEASRKNGVSGVTNAN